MPAQQGGTIRGSVTDKDFGAPLPAVQVSAVGAGPELKTTTVDEGNYVLREVPPGTYTLVFAKDGYVRQIRSNVVVVSGRLTEVSVAMTGDFTDMDEVVVQDVLQPGGGTESALLQLRFESPSLMDSISSDLMNRAGASDAASALRLVAGATVHNGKSAVIRGLPDRYVSSQMNGVRLPSADEDKRAVELDQFPSAVIESIRVSKSFTPEQQGDASGGAVDVRLKGVPDQELFLQYTFQVGHNTQTTGRSDFLSYDGGGVHFWGHDGGGRGVQQIDPGVGQNWDGAVGVSTEEAPMEFKWSAAGGGKTEIADGVAIGGFASFFYSRDSSYHGDGINDSLWVEGAGNPLTPKTSGNGSAQGGDFTTALYDVQRGTQSVQWGGLGTFGLESVNNSVTLACLFTRTAEDTATLAEDTRGKQFFFPGYDPDDPTTPGHTNEDAAPYVRFETLQYTERTTGTLQLNGRHKLQIEAFGPSAAPELDWTLAQSSANSDQPDKRVFGSSWVATNGGLYRPLKPSANFNLGNVQRIYKRIEEDSDQVSVNLKLPFEQWSENKGYLKFGAFQDSVDRIFDQDTFTNGGDNATFAAPFDQFWSSVYSFQNHPFLGSDYDVDYAGKQKIRAWYGMLDLPLSSRVDLIGGVRFESTRLSVVNDPGPLATWFPQGSLTPVMLSPGQADVSFLRQDYLPSFGIVVQVTDQVTLRTSYAETVARQTFKEVTPILQQEYVGGPIFIGNNELEMSSLRNYDARLDYVPYEGGLLSASWFQKDITRPIEYVQRPATFDFTTALNYPDGRLSGIELEARQGLGQFWEPLAGFSLGANATLIRAKVTLPQEEIDNLDNTGIEAPHERDMTNAPEHLYNAYVTFESEQTGTQVGLFYTVQGDTLVAGAGTAAANFVPDLYALEYGTLDLSLSQRLGASTRLSFGAKNLTDPSIDEVYRSGFIGPDVLKSSFTRGVDYSISIGGEIKF